jgi:hypothetical protein
MKRILFAPAALVLSGCLDWQAAYDQAARRDCRKIVDSSARQACLDQVERNSSDRREQRRRS